MTDSPINIAHQLAPTPGREGTREDWVRHYAAQALGVYAAFHIATDTIPRNPVRGSRPDIGYLAILGTTSVAAAVAISGPELLPAELWELDPNGGALNGDWEPWLRYTLDDLGINPADIDPAYEASDFRSPSQVVTE